MPTIAPEPATIEVPHTDAWMTWQRYDSAPQLAMLSGAVEQCFAPHVQRAASLQHLAEVHGWSVHTEHFVAQQQRGRHLARLFAQEVCQEPSVRSLEALLRAVALAPEAALRHALQPHRFEQPATLPPESGVQEPL